MVTKKQKQDLIEALKFTPREIRITLSGYGGEIVIGRITEAAYDYWSRHEDNLVDFVYDWGGDMQDVPADAKFCTDGCWYDVDDVCHESGVEFSDSCYITVTDELTGETLYEGSLNPTVLEDAGINTDCTDEVYIHQLDEGECVFVGQSIEKGVFFDGTVEINRPFDLSLLTMCYGDYEGWQIGCSVTYNGEDVDGSGGWSTTGKGSEFHVFRNQEVDADDDWDPRAELEKIDVPILEGEEMWAQEAIDSAEPETWQGIPLSPWWSGDEKPARRGEYEIFEEASTWPFPTRATWNGSSWKIKKEEVSVRIWRGLTQPAD